LTQFAQLLASLDLLLELQLMLINVESYNGYSNSYPQKYGNIKTYGTNKTSDEINHFHARDDGMEIHTLLFQVQVSITNRVKNVKLSE